MTYRTRLLSIFPRRQHGGPRQEQRCLFTGAQRGLTGHVFCLYFRADSTVVQDILDRRLLEGDLQDTSFASISADSIVVKNCFFLQAWSKTAGGTCTRLHHPANTRSNPCEGLIQCSWLGPCRSSWQAGTRRLPFLRSPIGRPAAGGPLILKGLQRGPRSRPRP